MICFWFKPSFCLISFFSFPSTGKKTPISTEFGIQWIFEMGCTPFVEYSSAIFEEIATNPSALFRIRLRSTMKALRTGGLFFNPIFFNPPSKNLPDISPLLSAFSRHLLCKNLLMITATIPITRNPETRMRSYSRRNR